MKLNPILLKDALYNLLPYDSYSNGVVTRQSWVVDEEYILKNYNTQYSTSDCYYVQLPNSIHVISDEGILVSNKTIPYLSQWVFTSSHYYTSSDGTINLFVMKTDLPNIQIQYKLSQSYTENVIDNTPLLALDQAGCNWVRDEFVKGLNLCFKQFVSGYIGEYYTKDLKPNTKYYLKCYGNVGPTVNYSLKIKDLSGNIIQTLADDGSYTTNLSSGVSITTNSSIVEGTTYIIRAQFNNSITTVGVCMLNAGSHAYPYSKYKGDIVRTSDIEPVLLWENPNKNSSYTSGTINPSDMSKYKYLVIMYKAYYYQTQAYMSLKIEIPTFSQNNAVSLSCNTASGYAFREIVITGATSVTINDCYYNGSVDSNGYRCIPIAIYGTNVL